MYDLLDKGGGVNAKNFAFLFRTIRIVVLDKLKSIAICNAYTITLNLRELE